MHHITKSNRNIHVLDNVFDLTTRVNTFEFIQGSYFRIGWEDSVEEKKRGYQNLVSVYGDNDVDRIPVYNALPDTPIAELVEGLDMIYCVANMSVPSHANFVHVHQAKKVVLYYANLEWQDGWHGETLFFDEAGKEIEFASPYTPGRVVVFDGTMPHSIRPQSTIAPWYRFTLAMFFN